MVPAERRNDPLDAREYAARVFERLGIDYCGGGKQTLRHACEQKKLDYDSVLAELERDRGAPEQGARNWASASVTDLCDHTEQSHHAT
jgi:regulator of cell morphogenesis and NO signaling